MSDEWREVRVFWDYDHERWDCWYATLPRGERVWAGQKPIVNMGRRDSLFFYPTDKMSDVFARGVALQALLKAFHEIEASVQKDIECLQEYRDGHETDGVFEAEDK